jgi:heat shock protein HslJ
MNKNLLAGLGIAVLLLLAIWMYKSYPQQAPVENNSQATAEENTADANSENDMPEETPVTNTLGGTAWLLDSVVLAGQAVNMDVNVPQPMTLNFGVTAKSNTYTGFGGCNSFSGTYTLAPGSKFSFGDTVSTKKYCPASSAMENSIFSAMEKADKFSISGGKLIIQSADGKTKLTYKEAI